MLPAFARRTKCNRSHRPRRADVAPLRASGVTTDSRKTRSQGASDYIGRYRRVQAAMESLSAAERAEAASTCGGSAAAKHMRRRVCNQAIRSMSHAMSRQVLAADFHQCRRRFFFQQRTLHPTGRDFLNRRGEANLPRRKLALQSRLQQRASDQVVGQETGPDLLADHLRRFRAQHVHPHAALDRANVQLRQPSFVIEVQQCCPSAPSAVR